MRAALLEVLYDLWCFALGACRRKSGGQTTTPSLPDGAPGPTLGTKAGGQTGERVFVRVPVTVGYARGEAPRGEATAQFYYGEPLQLLRTLAGWVEVEKGTVHVWIKKQDCTSEANEVFPSFTPLAVYTKADETTRRVRQCLQHLYPTEGSSFLRSDEFVLYRSFKERAAVPWEKLRTSPDSLWSKSLSGERAVKIEIEPHTSSVVEYENVEGERQYGYVTAVHPDLTIQLESVGRGRPGEYRVEEIPRPEWGAWQPKFISFR